MQKKPGDILLHVYLPFVFDPSNNSKNQNFEKMKKIIIIPGGIIILHKCTIIVNHMMHSS